VTARIINRGRGPEIEGTRITVYRVMDYVRAGDPPERIRDELLITPEQVEAALEYVRSHSEEVNREYDRILERIRQGNPEWVMAGAAHTPEELKERFRQRLNQRASVAAVVAPA
jgi:uncharacterized protein (DUF433 family)